MKTQQLIEQLVQIANQIDGIKTIGAPISDSIVDERTLERLRPSESKRIDRILDGKCPHTDWKRWGWEGSYHYSCAACGKIVFSDLLKD